MTNDEFLCMRDAVNLARGEQLRTVAALRSRLTQHGWSKETIQKALVQWANYERGKSVN
jgi:hypothetical protein